MLEVRLVRSGAVRRPPRIGDQLSLELAGPGREWSEPWGGKSPRVLTQAWKRFSLGAPPTGGLHGDEKVCTDYELEALGQGLFPFMGFDGIK